MPVVASAAVPALIDLSITITRGFRLMFTTVGQLHDLD